MKVRYLQLNVNLKKKRAIFQINGNIYTIPSNPTIADNYAFLYYADNCEKVSNQHLDSTEFLEVKEYTEDEINDLIKNNEFVQPIHLMGWLMVKKGVL